MTRIVVTSHYRYQRPPRKRKPVAQEAPAIVTATAATEEGVVQPSTPREAARVVAPPPVNDDRKPAMATKPAIVMTGRKQRSVADLGLRIASTERRRAAHAH